MFIDVEEHAMPLGVKIDALDCREVSRIFRGPKGGASVVHLCNAFNLLLAAKDPDYRRVMNAGDVNLPDGWPAVWAGRLLGAEIPGRVAGADLCDEMFRIGTDKGTKHFFYGGTSETLAAMLANLRRDYPGIDIAGAHAPPFRSLTDPEADEIVGLINSSGADIVWVGLGTPKQDFWMEEFRHRLDAKVLVGVGAAFDFFSGAKKRAPKWMQRSGLEWLHRLLSEPRRLWRRYLIGNPEFVIRFIRQYVSIKVRRSARGKTQ